MHRRPELVARRRCWYEWDMVIGVRNLVERSLGQGGQSIGTYIGDWCWSLPSLPPIPQYIPRHLDISQALYIPSCLIQLSTLLQLALLPPLPHCDVVRLLRKVLFPLLTTRRLPAQPSSTERRSKAQHTLVVSSPAMRSKEASSLSLNLSTRMIESCP